jgi:hypothetical protein
MTLALSVAACSHNPHKAEKIETKIENQEVIKPGESLGLNDKGEMIFQKKIQLASYLKDLQVEVYSLETEIYGDDSTGRKGIYGALRDCLDEVRSKKHGGDGKVAPPPTKDIRTKGEDMTITALLEKAKEGKIGLDEKKKLVGVTEEYLLDRTKRFEGYRSVYQDRKEWFNEQNRKCEADLAASEKATDKSPGMSEATHE